MKRWLRILTVFLASACLAALFGCKDEAPQAVVSSVPLEPSAETAVIRIDIAEATATPTPVPTPTPQYPTATPKETYVPIPSSTPDPKQKVAPTPTPEWATPYPSPTGKPSVTLEDPVTMVRVDTRTQVNGSLVTTSWHIGTAEPGSLYPLTDDSYRDFYRISYNGVKGYVRRDCCSVTEVSPAQTGDITYSIASFNVHNLGSGAYLDAAAEYLASVDADVVGIQEIDNGTARAGGLDLTKLLATAAGYPYWSFCKAINYSGGAYGTAILSKYPILSAASVKLAVAVGKEGRSLGYARILTPNGAVNVFNTHLCPSAMCFKSHNLVSFRYELARTGVFPYVVTGDFNCSPGTMSRLVPDLSYANVTGNTFGDGSVPKILDNILYTDGVQAYDVTIDSGGSQQISDHLLVMCRILIRKP